MANSNELRLNLKELLTTEVFSDLVIVCGEKRWKVHRCILYLQSSFFRQLLAGKFKEASENHGVIELEDDADAMHVLIHYLYNCGYDDSICAEKFMSFNVKVYAIANKYDVKQLQKFAATRLSRVFKPHHDIDDFISTIYAVDESTSPEDKTLWNVIIPTIKENISFLLGNAEFKNMLDKIPQIKFDLLAMLDPTCTPGSSAVVDTRTAEIEAESDEEDEDDEEHLPPPPSRGSRGYRGAGRRLG